MTEQAPSSPRPARTSVMLRAEIFREGTRDATQHRVLNLSATGLCVAARDEFTPDSAVAVSIGQVEHAAADVVWVRAGKAGLRFREPLDVAAARRPRVGDAALPPAAGWMAELNSPYRIGA